MGGIGTFRWWPSSDRWYWNDALFELHGYEPGGVTPSRALLLAHAHPRDRAQVAERAVALAVRLRPARGRYRIVTSAGTTRAVACAVGPVVTEGDEIEMHGWIVPLEEDLGALPLVPPAPEQDAGELEGLAIPLPRGREGTGPAAHVVPGEAAGEAAVPTVRAAEATDARHAALLRRAHDTLVAGLDLSHEAAAGLVAWLANAQEVPPVVIAENLADLDRGATGRPDLAALIAVLDGGPQA